MTSLSYLRVASNIGLSPRRVDLEAGKVTPVDTHGELWMIFVDGIDDDGVTRWIDDEE
jgi:hypothetical protein